MEGMTQRFRTNETRLQDLQQTAILSPGEERLLKLQSRQFKFAIRSQDDYDDVVVSRGGDDTGHDVWLP